MELCNQAVQSEKRSPFRDMVRAPPTHKASASDTKMGSTPPSIEATPSPYSIGHLSATPHGSSALSLGHADSPICRCLLAPLMSMPCVAAPLS